MIIALVSPVLSDANEVLEHLALTNEFKFVNLEDTLSTLSDDEFQKYVLDSDAGISNALKKLEDTYGVVVVYADTSISDSMLAKLVAEKNIVVVCTREDWKTYKELPGFDEFGITSDSDIEPELYLRYLDLYNSLCESDSDGDCVFMYDSVSNPEDLYSLSQVIEDKEVPDSNSSVADASSIVLLAVAQKSTDKKSKPKKKKSSLTAAIESAINDIDNDKPEVEEPEVEEFMNKPEEAAEEPVSEAAEETVEDSIKESLENLGMSDLVAEVPEEKEKKPKKEKKSKKESVKAERVPVTLGDSEVKTEEVKTEKPEIKGVPTVPTVPTVSTAPTAPTVSTAMIQAQSYTLSKAEPYLTVTFPKGTIVSESDKGVTVDIPIGYIMRGLLNE